MGLYDYLRTQGILGNPNASQAPMVPPGTLPQPQAQPILTAPSAPAPPTAPETPQGFFGPDVEAALNKWGFATDDFGVRLLQGLGAVGSQDPMAAAAGFAKNRMELAKAAEDKKRQAAQDAIAARRLTLDELKANKPVLQSSGVPGFSIAIYPDGRVENVVNDAAVEAYQRQQERVDARADARFNQQAQLLDRRLQSSEKIAADRQAAADRKGAKLNTSLQKEEDADFSTIDGAKAAAADIQPVIDNLTSGKLQLGALQNAFNASRNFFGRSNEQSQAYAELQRGITRITNESLRLNKGVQTEGDAQRAAKEVLAAFANNDTALMTKSLQDLQRINLRAAENKAIMIDRRRASQGVESAFGNPTPVAAPPSNSNNNDPLGIRKK